MHAGSIVSADGVALGLVDGEDLVIVDPAGLAANLRTHETRSGLNRPGLLTGAAREGSVQLARDRSSLEKSYPDSARTLPSSVRAAIAVPLRARGDAVGSVGFLFAADHALDDDTLGLARIVADLAGQALERAKLYEREQESRRALERILLVAPRFLADETEDVAAAICREARVTFGADYGVLWRIHEDEIELRALDPPRPDLAGSTLRLEDFPRLRGAIQGLGTSFVPDVLQTTRGAGLDFVRRLGVRSSLRTPMVVSGASELVLSISWESVISEPDPATIAVVRRFVDQAGLALEQVERRRAEAETVARAEATRRLHEVTAALSQATTSLDVSNTCLEHALRAAGAEAGFVVLQTSEGVELDVVTTHGYDDDELEAWCAASSSDDVPFARVLASGEPVWALTADEMAAFTGIVEGRARGWISLPLKTRRGTIGALHLSLRTSRVVSDAEREWLESMVSQCGQALERSGLFEEEQRSRLLAERLQNVTALLSNAVTPSDVASVIVEQTAAAVEASSVTLAAVRDDELGSQLGSVGDRAITASVLELGVSAESPAGRALRERRPIVLNHDSEGPGDEAVGTVLLVPLVAGRRANGLLLAAWREPRRLTSENTAIVEALAGQAALAMDRAQQFESEQTIAETLQRSVLPVSLPQVDGVQMAARYLPGSAQLDVGGDWFDALRLHDGRLGLVVGDVVGKGVQAAASMAQLRNAIRAFSVERLKPSSMLGRLNLLATDVLETSFATLVYLVLDPATGTCRFSSAGHPPPLLLRPDGRVEYLEHARGLPLGTGVESKYRQETVELGAGSLVLLYTDGLVERRGHSIDEGLDALRRAVVEGPRDPDRLLDHILDRVVGREERGDDIALLAVRALPVAPQQLTLRLRAELSSMDVVRDAMRVWLGGTTLDRREVEDVVLATWEACANAIEHAVEPTSDLVLIAAEAHDGEVRVVVSDSGEWAPASGRDGRGLGLPLIESLVTSVDVARTGSGTTVTLVKTLAAEPAAEAAST
jgi:serine phosphatase RsbU (regulator of sigma subunit)/anti-sigma regulatory factor (Ser/Thr protein kinase)